MAPETHTRYRVQRLIRMGEWLEKNRSILLTCFEALDKAHDAAIDASEDIAPHEVLDQIITAQTHPLMAMSDTLIPLLRDDWGGERGKDVTLHHPYACEDRRYEVVIKAPTPKLPGEA